jgi:ABC-type cobalamin/Fe3+-siderophores transport system ATPase subunit/ABC-type Fe3+-siderophore transport system permease subunit
MTREWPYLRLLACLAGLVAALFLASLLIGPAALGLGDSLAALIAGRGEAIVLVMRDIRLPRALLGLMIGAALGLSGAAMQGFLRNPLAEPGLIGVSSSAALGAVLALQTGLAAAFTLALPLAALAGAGVSVLLILGLAGPRGGAFTLILAGIAISALAGAGVSLVLNLSPNPFAAAEIVFWMMGSLADRSMVHVALAAPFLALGAGMLLRLGRGLDALTLGEDAAEAMGLALSRLRLQLVLGTALMVGGGGGGGGVHRLCRAGGAASLAPAGGGAAGAAAGGVGAGGRGHAARGGHRRAADRAGPRPEAGGADRAGRRAVLPASDLADAEGGGMSLLSLDALTVRRGTCPVVDEVTLRVDPGEFIGLIGPNGAGKTSLLRGALGLLAAEGGSSLAALPLPARARAAAFLPQSRDIAWPVTVETLVALGRVPHGGGLTAADRAAVDRALARMGLDAYRGRTATALSGGEQARVLIARALAQDTPLLLADEPVAGLDPESQIRTMQVFAGLAAEGRAVIASIHDLGLAARHCTRLVMLSRGRVAADGPPADVLTPAHLDRVFGVRAFYAQTPDGPVFQPLDVLR